MTKMKTLFKNANVLPIESKPFKGDVLVDNGKIKSMGDLKDKGDKETEIIDLEGKYLLPGFIDAHSHIGLWEEGVNEPISSDGNEWTDPVTADIKAIDGFDPEDEAIDRALRGGVTTVMIVPGSANPIGGQGAIIKFKSRIVNEMIVREPAGLKMAFGENPKRVYGEQKKTPSTRLGVASIIRSYFTKVQDYMKKKENYEREGKVFFERDLKLEAGEKVLRGEVPARIHAHRYDDILTAIRIAQEFSFKFVIEHGTEGYKIADYLKNNNIPVVVGPLMTFRTKRELKDMTMASIKILNEKGILTALMCDHPVIPLEYASVQAASALKYGAKEEDLLKMLTLNAAKILGIEDRVGSIKKGKDADLVIWSGHPFDMKSVVEAVYIEGIRII